MVYSRILRIRGAWRFSFTGLILRLPMSMMGISIILLVKSEYGNYTLAGAVSAVNIVALAVCAPILARLVDEHGQMRIMGPALAVCAASASGLLVAATTHAPSWVLFACAALAGATWGSPGALVRSRWATVVDDPRDLTTAYAFEAAMDEIVFILGPVLATVLGTSLHAGTGVALSVLFLVAGGAGFLAQRSSEPAPVRREPGIARASVIFKPAVLVLALTYIGAGMLFGANDVSVVAFTEALGAPAMSGVLLAVFSTGSLVAALVYGARSWVQPLWRLYMVGIIALAVGTTTFLAAHHLWSMAVTMLITGMACAPTMTNVNMIIARIVPASQLTEGLAWMSTSMNLGVSLGAAVAGRAVDSAGAHGGYVIVVGAGWIMVALMLVGVRSLRRDTEEEAPTLD
ncbi:MFS transporter [Actinomyces sp. B33]|uniref:MFS transporter n=1 Tax=Actinomyces sp. B33 TaxID=2942131 RepID=UPI0023403F56|nr:MFS transporter [Actinomyces sp. B33]MDC4233433.1 MFS transporter [Actinomyces sp. B33]